MPYTLDKRTAASVHTADATTWRLIVPMGGEEVEIHPYTRNTSKFQDVSTRGGMRGFPCAYGSPASHPVATTRSIGAYRERMGGEVGVGEKIHVLHRRMGQERPHVVEQTSLRGGDVDLGHEPRG